jgi:hypothetical protein
MPDFVHGLNLFLRGDYPVDKADENRNIILGRPT